MFYGSKSLSEGELSLAHTLFLYNADRTLRAEVVPNHGGMISRIQLRGREILHLDSGALENAPMAAGGSPFLFPCPSKTRNDRYRLNGRDYYMPMHGLLKNAPFAVKSASDSAVTLWSCGNPVWMEANYPFDFYLELTYRLEGNSVFFIVEIENRSTEPMPHCLGWHPFFRAVDKRQVRLEHSMKVHYDYVECRDEAPPAVADLSQSWDDVFHSPENPVIALENPADGYAARMRFDEAFQAMVVYTGREGCVCVEPWCGIPDSINNGRFLQWIPGGETARYTMELELSPI